MRELRMKYHWKVFRDSPGLEDLGQKERLDKMVFLSIEIYSMDADPSAHRVHADQ